MDRVYQANAIETPPSSTASSGSYPTAGNKAAGQLATVPGPYWFYSITEEIRNAIIAAGMTPDPAQVNQLSKAFGQYLPLAGGNVTGALSVQGKAVARAVNGVGADSNGNVSLGNLVKSVNGTAADANGNVAISIPATPKAYITETWKNGTEWYRKWSDGWIEQGGKVFVQSSSTILTVHTPFTNTNYSVLCTNIDNVINIANITYNHRSATTVEIDYNGGYSGYCYWRASGY